MSRVSGSEQLPALNNWSTCQKIMGVKEQSSGSNVDKISFQSLFSAKKTVSVLPWKQRNCWVSSVCSPGRILSYFLSHFTRSAFEKSLRMTSFIRLLGYMWEEREEECYKVSNI